MAFSSADWTIDYALKTVTNNDSGTGNNLPVALGNNTKVGPILEFFQWLATTFANSAQMDDDYAIQSDTPTVYKWLDTWAFGHADDTKYLSGGSIQSADGAEAWANLYTIGSQTEGTLIALYQNSLEVTPWWITGNLDILVKVKAASVFIQSDDTAGVATDGGVWLYAREFGDLYDHGFANLSGLGRNPLGINTSLDSGNKSGELFLSVLASTNFTVGSFVVGGTSGAVGKITKVVGNDIYLSAVREGIFVISETIVEYSDRELQSVLDGSTTNDGTTAFTNVVAGYTDITTTFGTISRDLNNGSGAQNYDVEIDAATRSMLEVYEWEKYITRYGSVGATYTVNGDDGQEYRSAIEGTYAEAKVAPFGTLAGATFYGARGIWVTNYSLAEFVLIDANNTEQAPPDYQKVVGSHANLIGVQLFVSEITGAGGTVIKNQYTILGTTVNTIQATAAINANKAAQSGSLRVADTVYTYTGIAGDTLTGVSPDPTGETGAFYIPLMDTLADAVTEQSDNLIFTAPFDVRVVARKYGFKPYSVDTTFAANGLPFSPILSVDPQAV